MILGEWPPALDASSEVRRKDQRCIQERYETSEQVTSYCRVPVQALYQTPTQSFRGLSEVGSGVHFTIARSAL